MNFKISHYNLLVLPKKKIEEEEEEEKKKKKGHQFIVKRSYYSFWRRRVMNFDQIPGPTKAGLDPAHIADPPPNLGLICQ